MIRVEITNIVVILWAYFRIRRFSARIILSAGDCFGHECAFDVLASRLMFWGRPMCFGEIFQEVGARVF